MIKEYLRTLFLGEGYHQMKMYILVRELFSETTSNLESYYDTKKELPVGNAIVAAAHASLACYLKFQDNPSMVEWVGGPFAKVVCKVTDPEFELAKEIPDHVVITESMLGGQEVAIAFCPREDYPKGFKFFRRYK